MSLKFRVSLVEIKNILYLKTKLKRYELICGKICGESAVCTWKKIGEYIENESYEVSWLGSI